MRHAPLAALVGLIALTACADSLVTSLIDYVEAGTRGDLIGFAVGSIAICVGGVARVLDSLR